MSEVIIEKTEHEVVAELIEKAKVAMDQIKDYTQEQANELVKAAAWAIYKQDHAETLAEISVRDTWMFERFNGSIGKECRYPARRSRKRDDRICKTGWCRCCRLSINESSGNTSKQSNVLAEEFKCRDPLTIAKRCF